MFVQNKPNAKIFELRVHNIKGIEVFEHKFVNGQPCVVYGKNGSGKSSIIDGFYLALKGKSGLPNKIDQPVGPYDKKGTVEMRIKAEPGATELGEDLFLQFGISEAGNVSLKITDEKTGTIHKTSPRKKVEKLLGLFLDPVELKKTLEDTNGDRKLAEKLCAMVGLDLQPFVNREAELFAQFQDENKELKRQQGVFDTLDVPQDDWAIEYTDPAIISNQLQQLNELRSRNEQRVWNIVRAYTELEQTTDASKKLADEITAIDAEGRELQRKVNIQGGELEEKRLALATFAEENKPVEWTGTQDIEEKIRALTEELTRFRIHEKSEMEKKQAIEAKARAIEMDTERLVAAKKEVTDKATLLEKRTAEKSSHDQLIVWSESKVDRAHEVNSMESWKGETDPGKAVFPSVWLKEKMANVTARNRQFEARKAYDIAESGLKTVKESIEEINRARKVNADAKARAVASVKEKFPHPGITVDENTVWVDLGDRRGKRTINDLSEGEKLMICTHILIAGNTGVLDVLIIRDGSSLDSDNKKIIYDIAAEHGYTVILETIETSENGALHIVEGRVQGVNQTVLPEIPVATQEPVESQSHPNW
ncbi:hypothetical protein KKI24_09060 [bacterium]|nr:hypothetical protein [bacterium]